VSLFLVAAALFVFGFLVVGVVDTLIKDGVKDSLKLEPVWYLLRQCTVMVWDVDVDVACAVTECVRRKIHRKRIFESVPT